MLDLNQYEIANGLPSEDYPLRPGVSLEGHYIPVTDPSGVDFPVTLQHLREQVAPKSIKGMVAPFGAGLETVAGKEGQTYWQDKGSNAVTVWQYEGGAWVVLHEFGPTAISTDAPANAAPTVALTVSRASLTLGQSLTLSATATDSDGTVARVDLYEGDTLLVSDTTLPYLLTVTPDTVGEKSYSAVAVDNLGARRATPPQRVQVLAVGNQNPLISAFSSASTIVAGQQVTFSATASDPDGSINRVEFYDGPTLLGSDPTDPYSVTFAPTVTGNHQLVAKAIDNAGGSTTTAVIPLTVTAGNGNNAPTVTLSASPSTVQAGGTVTLNATANDTDGVVTKVEYFNSSTKLGESITTPHSFTYPITAAGTNFFTAKATDNAGATGLSGVVFVLAQDSPTQNTTPAAPSFSNFSDTQEGGTVTLVPASGIPLADYRVSLPGNLGFSAVSSATINVGNTAGAVRAYSVAATGRNESPTAASQAFTAYTAPSGPSALTYAGDLNTDTPTAAQVQGLVSRASTAQTQTVDYTTNDSRFIFAEPASLPLRTRIEDPSNQSIASGFTTQMLTISGTSYRVYVYSFNTYFDTNFRVTFFAA